VSERTGTYTQTKSALHFPVGAPLPQKLVRELIELKLREAGFR
jgi:hypothetical protein